MNLNELRFFLSALGVSPKKGLAQNFLIDNNIIAKIIHEADVIQGDSVLEIGPGAGAITKELVKEGAEVTAVELDAHLAQALQQLSVTVYHDDILTFPLEKLARKGKVVSNLPYHLTAPILARFIPRNDLFSSLTVVVQEEMARRLTASPCTPAYGSLTVFLNFYTSARYAFRVSRRCFYPIPNVDSAVVSFTLKEPPAVDPNHFFKLVRTAFQQRRKMIKNTIAHLYGEEIVINALKKAEIDLKARPEDLSLRDFLAIFKLMTT